MQKLVYTWLGLSQLQIFYRNWLPPILWQPVQCLLSHHFLQMDSIPCEPNIDQLRGAMERNTYGSIYNKNFDWKELQSPSVALSRDSRGFPDYIYSRDLHCNLWYLVIYYTIQCESITFLWVIEHLWSLTNILVEKCVFPKNHRKYFKYYERNLLKKMAYEPMYFNLFSCDRDITNLLPSKKFHMSSHRYHV